MQDHIIKIRQLRQVLENNGYYPHQIRDIIHDCIGRSDLNYLSESEAASLVSCLEEYIAFVRKQHKDASRKY